MVNKWLSQVAVAFIVSSQVVAATWKTLFYLGDLPKNWFEYYSKSLLTG